MKNFTINGYSKSPLGEVTNNQTMMCIVEVDGEGVQPYLLVKTSDAYYQLPMEKITEEEFNAYFIEDESENE